MLVKLTHGADALGFPSFSWLSNIPLMDGPRFP